MSGSSPSAELAVGALMTLHNLPVQQRTLLPAAGRINADAGMPPPDPLQKTVNSLEEGVAHRPVEEDLVFDSSDEATSPVPALTGPVDVGFTAQGLIGELATADLQSKETFDLFARFVETSKTLYGDEKQTQALQCLSANTDNYEAKKKAVLRSFLLAVSNHSTLHRLAEYIPHPISGKQTAVFFVYMQYSDPMRLVEQQNIMNACLVVWGQTLTMKKVGKQGHRYYQPSSILTFHRILFSVFKSNGIKHITMRDFEGKVGSFHAMWKGVYEKASKEDETFGKSLLDLILYCCSVS